MSDSNPQLQLRRTVVLKTIVTPSWKEQTQQQFQTQINQIDGQIQQLELQGQRMIAEIQKQTIQPPGPETLQQIDNVQMQITNNKSELLEQKNQILQQINRVQLLEMDQEVEIGQIDSFFNLQKGDNLFQKLQVEILLRDGAVEDIRGDV
jgi:predicted phage tail protein